MDINQILAIAIFVIMFVFIVWDIVHRYIPALIASALVIFLLFLIVMRSPESVTEVLNLGQLTHGAFWIPGTAPHAETHGGINWQTIIFIGGMMVMVEGMGNVGFFRWLCLFLAKKVNYRLTPILISFMLLSAFLAMFIDSITVLLFLASVTIELARLLKFDPVPIIIAEIFASNVGGAATMCGDPPNIIIGTALNYTFTDFALNTGPIAWISMIFVVGFFYLMLRKSLASAQKESTNDTSHYPEPREAITDPRLFKISAVIFISIVILLVTHAQTGLSVAIIGVIAAAMTICAALLAGGDLKHIISRVDWRTLVFFIGLFIVVGGLEKTEVLKMMAEFIGDISGGNIMVVIPIILWVSAFASAIVDNIPFAATMVPVISSLAATTGMSQETLSWTLALGTDIGGNATPIGASANVVGTAIAEREGYPVSWGRFLKYALPAMIFVVGICYLYLILRYA